MSNDAERDAHVSHPLESDQPLLRVTLLGVFHLHWPVPSLDDRDIWKSRTAARSLLKVLLCAPQRHATRSQLAGLLWPETDEAHARESLRSALKVLRAVFASASRAPLVQTPSTETIQLADQTRVFVDVDAFESLVSQARRASSQPLQRSLWVQAKALVQGEFLADEQLSAWFHAHWVRRRRLAVHAARRVLVRSLADLYLQEQQPTLAEELLQEHVLRFPTDQDALLRLMRLLIAAQCFDEARLCYERCQTALATFGKHPAEPLKALASSLLTWHVPLIASWRSAHPDSLRTPHASGDIALPFLRPLDSENTGDVGEAPPSPASPGHTPVTAPQAIIAAFHPLSSATFSVEKETLPLFDALIETCFRLREGNQLHTAERVLWSFLPQMERATHHASASQQHTATRAAQGYYLAASLAGHRSDLQARLHYSEQACFSAHMARDPNLEVAALRQVAVTFGYLGRPHDALQTYQRALPSFHEVSPRLQACIYAALSGMSAQLQHRQEAERFLSLAYTQWSEGHIDEPPVLRLMPPQYQTIVLWHGLMSLELGHVQEAEHTLGQIDMLTPAAPLSERLRSDYLLCHARVSLAAAMLEQACTLLEAAFLGATALDSTRRRRDCLSVLQQLRARWPHEPRVRDVEQRILQLLITPV